MKASMWVQNEKLKIFQDLMKQYNVYFEYNPMIGKEKTYVAIDGDHLPMTTMNDFFSSWERMNCQIKEVPQKTKIQKFTNKLQKFFK